MIRERHFTFTETCVDSDNSGNFRDYKNGERSGFEIPKNRKTHIII